MFHLSSSRYHFKTAFLPWHTELVKITHSSQIHLHWSDSQPLHHTAGGMGYNDLQNTGIPCYHRAEKGWESNPFHQIHLCSLLARHTSLRWGHTEVCRYKQTDQLHRVMVVLWQDLKIESKSSHVDIRRVYSVSNVETF